MSVLRPRWPSKMNCLVKLVGSFENKKAELHFEKRLEIECLPAKGCGFAIELCERRNPSPIEGEVDNVYWIVGCNGSVTAVVVIMCGTIYDEEIKKLADLGWKKTWPLR